VRDLQRQRLSEARGPALQVQTLEEFTATGAAVTLIVCSGWLSGTEGPRLRDQLLVHMGHGPRHLLLDLQAVTAVDHVATAMLVSVNLRARIAGCSFSLIGAGPRVLEQLTSTPRGRTVTRFHSLEDALTAI
jgi:anti-anti-sigma regulatory factor